MPNYSSAATRSAIRFRHGPWAMVVLTAIAVAEVRGDILSETVGDLLISQIPFADQGDHAENLALQQVEIGYRLMEDGR